MKDLHELPKLRDSLSFVYFEKARIEKKDNAIAVFDQDGEIHVPSAALGLLMLGPGTSITHEAVKVLADSGCSILWVGGDGTRVYGQGMGETRSARRLLRQAQLHADPVSRGAVVFKMYEKRFDEKLTPDLSIQQIRGREGVRVRTAYERASKETGVVWKGRNYDQGNWGAADRINRALSTAASCLYGICHCAIVSAGYSTALGFIHTGKLLSFVYDIADLYRIDTVVPVAFEITSKYDKDYSYDRSFESEIRYACRESFRKNNLLERIIADIDSLMQVEQQDMDWSRSLFDGSVDRPGGLWDPNDDSVEGGINYGGHDLGEGYG